MPPWFSAPNWGDEEAVAALRYVRRVGERWCPTTLGRAVGGDRRGLTCNFYSEDWQRWGRLGNRRRAHRWGVVSRDADRARVGAARLTGAMTMAAKGNRYQQQSEDKECPDAL